jgi:excisionase family DNA binding protein
MNEANHLAHSVDVAHRRLGIGKTTLYELIAAGRIRAVKVGARTLIPESELQRFLADELSKQHEAAA